MKQKTQKKVMIGALILIGIFLIWYFGFRELSIIPSQIYSTTTTLENYDLNSATYLFSFVSEPMGRGDCREQSPDSFDFNVPTIQTESQLPEFIDGIGIEENKDYETTEVEIDGLSATVNICSGNEIGVTTEVRNAKAICRISKGILIQGVPRANINCRFIGDVYALENGNEVNAKIMGLSSGSATITFTNNECQIGQTLCSDGICRDSCQCANGTTQCSDGTCKESCEKPSGLIWIILVMVLIIGGLGFVYYKTRRKR